MRNLIRLSRVKEISDFPVRVSTLYQWRIKKRFPELFVKLGGTVFIDRAVLEDLIEKGRGQ